MTLALRRRSLPTAGKALTAWPPQGKLLWVKVGVTEIGGDGTIRRRALDTWCLADADRWEYVIGQFLTLPPCAVPELAHRL